VEAPKSDAEQSTSRKRSPSEANSFSTDAGMSITDGETAVETELCSEPQTGCEPLQAEKNGMNGIISPTSRPRKAKKVPLVSHHDLLNKYFKKDTVLVFNIDLFRYARSLRLGTDSAKSSSAHRISPLCSSSATRLSSHFYRLCPSKQLYCSMLHTHLHGAYSTALCSDYCSVLKAKAST
jgi:hypothetical protein